MSFDQPGAGSTEPARYVFGPFAPGPPPPVGAPVPPPVRTPRGRRTLPIVLGAAALALVLLVVGIAVGVRRTVESPGPTTDPTAASTSAAPAAKASDAVQGYLQALAAGDAETALSYAATPVADPGLATSKVLAASLKRAPMTAIEVPDVSRPSATTVVAQYRLGSTDVAATFPVRKVGDVWKLEAVVAEVDVSLVRDSSLPMLVNGAKVTRDTVSLLPGSYAFTTGTANLDYGKRSTVLVTDPGDEPAVYQLERSVTSKGKAAAVAASKKSYGSCLRSDDAKPSGCPNRWTSSSVRWRNGTLDWSQIGADPFKKVSVRTLAEQVQVDAPLRVRLDGTCTQNGRTGRCTNARVTGGMRALVTVSGSSVKVRWLV